MDAHGEHRCDDGDLLAPLKGGKLALPDDYEIPPHRHHTGTFTSVREAKYRGKSIRVETTYKITIDDEPVQIHTGVSDDGSVNCHGFPNYSFRSAVDLARKLVDASGYEPPPDELSGEQREHTDHAGGHH